MKKYIIISLLFMILSGHLFSQSDYDTRIPLLGEMTPEFSTKTTAGNLNFPDDYGMKWKIIFSHPADFTPVCSSEILTLASMQDEFEELNTKIMVLSTDGLSSHMAWVKSLETIAYPGEEAVAINFPLIPDADHEISRKFGMIHSYTSSTRDVRGVFIIDSFNRIRAIFFYPMNIGRNMEEIKRTLIALQTSEKHDVLIPANWSMGKDVMISSPANKKEADKLEKKKDPNLSSLAWYMWFEKMPN